MLTFIDQRPFAMEHGFLEEERVNDGCYTENAWTNTDQMDLLNVDGLKRSNPWENTESQ